MGLRTMILFVLNCGAVILFYMMQVSYTGGVVRTLERRFGLNSQQSGTLSSITDTAHIAIVVFIGYLARRYNKPRLLAITVLFLAVGGFLMSLPYFILPAKQRPDTAAVPSKVLEDLGKGLCGNASNKTDEEDQVNTTIMSDNGKINVAYVIFIVAQCISGLGSSGIYTISFSYVDENSTKTHSSIFLGILMSLFSFGPLCGFMLAALTLRWSENLANAIDIEDDTAIGNWWLGYVVCSGSLLLLSFPLFFFPTKISSGPSTEIIETEIEQSSSRCEKLKEFPREVFHLFKNKLYVVSLLQAVCGSYIVIGIFASMVRYIEIHFIQDAFIASTVTAIVLALFSGLGALLGGLLMSKMELTPLGALRLMMLSSVTMVIGFSVVLILNCPQPSIHGNIDPETGLLHVDTECSKSCGCSSDLTDSFHPVCSSQGHTFYSPCHAGCHSILNQTYLDCTCTGPNISESYVTLSPDVENWAKKGLCEIECNLLIPFGIVICIVSFIGAIARVPATIVTFRIVDEDERSMAMSLNSCITNVLGFIPAPILFGVLTDSSCILWDGSDQEAGACLLYDTTKLRHRTYWPGVGFEILEFIFSLTMFLMLRCSRSDFTAEKKDRPTPEEPSLNSFDAIKT